MLINLHPEEIAALMLALDVMYSHYPDAPHRSQALNHAYDILKTAWKQRDKLQTSEAKLAWRDVAGDACREGRFKEAVALLFEYAPEAMPYVAALEALARTTIEYVNHKHSPKPKDVTVAVAAYEELTEWRKKETALWLKLCHSIDQYLEVAHGDIKPDAAHLGALLGGRKYIDKLEDLATSVSHLVTFKLNAAGREQHPDFAAAFDIVGTKFRAYQEIAS